MILLYCGMNFHRVAQIAQELVRIPSVNPMGKPLSGVLYSENGMADYIVAFLQKLGLQPQKFGKDPDHPLVTCFIDAGQSETVMLQAHMDTVSQEQMSIPPFEGIIEQDRLWGRGSCDTKGSLSTYLYAVEKMILHNIPFKKNVLLAFVHDEEYSFGGARELMSHHPKADYAIVGEPTSLNIITAHKGVTRFFIECKGVSCHAALPWQGENAIYKMASVLQALTEYGKELLQGEQHPELGTATINVGRIWGGQTVNTVPASCTIEVDHRMLPGMSYDGISALLRPRLEPLGAILSTPYLEAPSVYNSTESLVCQRLKQATQQCSFGLEPTWESAHYATDASIIHHHGIPSVVFGPGSIDQAHTANEYIELIQLEKAAAVILQLLST